MLGKSTVHSSPTSFRITKLGMPKTVLREEPPLVACSSKGKKKKTKGKKKKTIMYLVSEDGKELLPCYSLEHKGTEKKHVIIYYNGMNSRMIGLLVCVPVLSLLFPKTSPPSQKKSPCKKYELELPCSVNLNCLMNCIITTSIGGENSPGPGIYFFGGCDPPGNCPWHLQKEYVLKNVYRYDLHKLPTETGSIIPREDMIYGMSNPLLVQIGDDCIYVLGYGKNKSNDSLRPAFQKYNFKKNKWTIPGDTNHFVDIMNKCDCDDWVRRNLHRVPYAVIGHKLHVSFGSSSFTFDTVKRIWEDCKLFETFWLKQEENKRCCLSPLDFYGSKVWNGGYVNVVKKRKREESGDGEDEEEGRVLWNEGLVCGAPFGFSGRGILWDKNILLGVHHAPNCPLVAFLLDAEDRVIKSQPISLDNLPLDRGGLHSGAILVDLGRGGYFGLVHMLSNNKSIWKGNRFNTELVTFKVSRPPKTASDNDDQFVVCQFVNKKVVAENCSDFCNNFYNAFSV